MYVFNYYRSVYIIVFNIFSNLCHPISKCSIMFLYIFFLLLSFRILLKRFEYKILEYDSKHREIQIFTSYISESFMKIVIKMDN